MIGTVEPSVTSALCIVVPVVVLIAMILQWLEGWRAVSHARAAKVVPTVTPGKHSGNSTGPELFSEYEETQAPPPQSNDTGDSERCIRDEKGMERDTSEIINSDTNAAKEEGEYSDYDDDMSIVSCS